MYQNQLFLNIYLSQNKEYKVLKKKTNDSLFKLVLLKLIEIENYELLQFLHS